MFICSKSNLFLNGMNWEHSWHELGTPGFKLIMLVTSAVELLRVYASQLRVKEHKDVFR